MLNEYEFNGGTLNGVGLPDIVRREIIKLISQINKEIVLSSTTNRNINLYSKIKLEETE